VTASKTNGYLLVANLVLVAAVAYLLKSRPPAADHAEARVPSGEPRVIIRANPPKTVTVTNDFRWTQLESEDYRTYIARLRAVGCPEATIRDIIIADLDKLLAPRVQSVYGRKKEVQYWHSEEEELANNFDHRDWARAEREIDREKRDVILELLGVDLVRERLKQQGHQDYYERRLGFLPEEKQTALRLLLERYAEQEESVRFREDDAAAPPEDLKTRLRELQVLRQAELAKLLSPDELKQYELWMSPTANAVRYAAYGMNATEDEFLRLYELRKAFDEKWRPEDLDLSDDAMVADYDRAKLALNAQVAAALGEERYALYLRGEDPDYHKLNAVASRSKVPREKADEVFEFKQTLLQAREKLRNNPVLTPAQKELALREMAAETEHAVRGILGEKAYRYLLQSGAAAWIQN
jgi:hypothetical protein